MNKLGQIKLKIYENCRNGEITEAERDILLEAAEDKYSDVESDPITESSEEEDVDDEAEFTEAVMSSVIDGEMTEEEAADLIMGYSEMMESSTEEEDDLLEEGTTTDDLCKDFKESNKRYKERLASAKRQMRRGDRGDAIDELKKAKEELLDCKKFVSEATVSIGQNALGFMGGSIASWGKGTLLGFVSTTLLSACGVSDSGAVSLGKSISKAYQIVSFSDDISDGLKRSGASSDAFNRAKSQIVKKINCEITNINRLIATLSK